MEKINYYRSIKELLLKEIRGEAIPGLLMGCCAFFLTLIFLSSLYGHCIATRKKSEECERAVDMELKTLRHEISLLKLTIGKIEAGSEEESSYEIEDLNDILEEGLSEAEEIKEEDSPVHQEVCQSQSPFLIEAR